MLPLLRSVVSGRLRRSLFTIATRPPWVMMDRAAQLTRSPEGVSSSFAPPPFASCITVPVPFSFFDLESPRDKSNYFDTMGSRVLAASGDGFLLLDTRKSRCKALPHPHPLADLDLPFDERLKDAPVEVVYRRYGRLVCNPGTGELFPLPDFHGADKTSTDCLLTQADGPPKRYAAAQLTEVDGGRCFMLRRISSETGEWGELVLPSPLPPGRRMHMKHEHEVLDFGGRLWWVDVSWGAVCVDPFSDQPELRTIELPAGSVLPGQQGEGEMRRLVKHRHMGASAGRLCYVEADPFHIRSFTLDEESGRWTLENQMSVADLWPNAKVMPSIATIDPLNTDVLHLNLEKSTVSVDIGQRMMIESSIFLCSDDISPPYQSFANQVLKYIVASSSYLPCVLPSILGSTPIPGKNDVEKNKTLADVLVRSDIKLKT